MRTMERPTRGRFYDKLMSLINGSRHQLLTSSWYVPDEGSRMRLCRAQHEVCSERAWRE